MFTTSSKHSTHTQKHFEHFTLFFLTPWFNFQVYPKADTSMLKNINAIVHITSLVSFFLTIPRVELLFVYPLHHIRVYSLCVPTAFTTFNITCSIVTTSIVYQLYHQNTTIFRSKSFHDPQYLFGWIQIQTAWSYVSST